MSLPKQSLSRAVSYCSILILPIASLYISLRNFRRPEAKNLFWLFCTFYGLTHIVFNSRGYYVDSVAYALQFMEIHGITTLHDLSSYVANTQKIDLYTTSLSFIISRFSSNYQLFFLVSAFIFGYFYSRNIWIILEKIGHRVDVRSYIYIAFFILLIPIWQINGRMWTAAHVFFYGAIQYILFNDKKKLIWCILSPIVHFSFIFPLFILFIYLFLPRKPLPYVILLVVSMASASIDLKFLNQLLHSILPSLFDSKVNAYANPEYANRLVLSLANYNLGIKVYNTLFDFFPKLGLILFYFTGKHLWKTNENIKNLLCFGLFISAMAGFIAEMPSGSRFLYVAYMFNISCIILIRTQMTEKSSYIVNILEWVFLIGLIGMILYSIRIGLMFISLSFFVTTPITYWFIYDNVPILQYFN